MTSSKKQKKNKHGSGEKTHTAKKVFPNVLFQESDFENILNNPTLCSKMVKSLSQHTVSPWYILALCFLEETENVCTQTITEKTSFFLTQNLQPDVETTVIEL